MDLIGVLFARALIVPPIDSEIQELAAEKAAVTTVPAGGSVGGTGLVSFQNSSGTQLFTLQLPLYEGGVE